MDIRQFRADLARAFEEAGFKRRVIPHSKDPSWLLSGCEVERIFSQHAMRRPWGFLLSGVLSIDVPDFQEWLTTKFPRNRHDVLRSSLLSWHIANDPDMFFAAEEDDPPYDEWVNQIRRRLAVLPDTIPALLRAERDDVQGLKTYFDSPNIWNYFKSWAEGAEPNHSPPDMLPTGQIVDTPANDRA